jgi:hypothetical protein
MSILADKMKTLEAELRKQHEVNGELQAEIRKNEIDRNKLKEMLDRKQTKASGNVFFK